MPGADRGSISADFAYTYRCLDQRTPNKASRSPSADDLGDDTSINPSPPDGSVEKSIEPIFVGVGDITKSELILGGPFQLGPGAMLGEYRIEGIAGEGGMGVVYAAVHPMIGKRAAIKVLKKELCEDTHTVERFIDEARVVNQIGHPNIVDIFAFGEMPGGRSYFVMEWLKGETLRARLARPPKLTLVEVCAILKPLARALQAAHDKGVIHRDLKPDNIFLGETDDDDTIPVKLLDFGIAKLASTEPRLERTATGTMIGTPTYIAPEQARGYAIDHRVDIYSLGALAFELITGRTPFIADNAMEMVAKHLLEPPPTVSSVAPNTPKALASIVSAMIQKEADARPTLAALLTVLDGVKTFETTAPNLRSPMTVSSPAARPPVDLDLTHAAPARPPSRTWIAVVGLALGSAALAFGVTYVARGSDRVALDAAILAPSITSPPVVDAAIDAPTTPEIVIDAASAPATAPLDAPLATVVEPPRPTRPPPPTRGKINLTLRGAPTADYVLDGKRVGAGRTIEITATVGEHDLEVRSGKVVEHVKLEISRQPTSRVITLPTPDPVPDGLMAPGSLNK